MRVRKRTCLWSRRERKEKCGVGWSLVALPVQQQGEDGERSREEEEKEVQVEREDRVGPGEGAPCRPHVQEEVGLTQRRDSKRRRVSTPTGWRGGQRRGVESDVRVRGRIATARAAARAAS